MRYFRTISKYVTRTIASSLHIRYAIIVACNGVGSPFFPAPTKKGSAMADESATARGSYREDMTAEEYSFDKLVVGLANGTFSRSRAIKRLRG
jgi:hypothetical protein